MTPPESTQSALTETSTMTQEECKQLKHHAFWSAFGSAIYIVIWIIAVIAILSASNSPSAAPPIILFGIILILTLGIGFRAYPGLKKAYIIWKNVHLRQIQFDTGIVTPKIIAAGRNVQMVLIVDESRSHATLSSVFQRLCKAESQEKRTNGRYCLRITPHSKIVVNAIPITEST